MPEKKTYTRATKRAASEEENFTHLQPQATDLERAVLGAVMVDGDAYPMVSEILKPESFYEKRNQLVYNAVQSLAMEEKPIDVLTVTNRLKETGDLGVLCGKVVRKCHKFVAYRVSRRDNRSKIPGAPTDIVYQQDSDGGFRRDSRCRPADADGRSFSVRAFAEPYEERLHAD